MRTVNLYEKGEEVLIKGKIVEVAMDNGDIVYQVMTIDNGKNMGIWLTEQQLLNTQTLENSTIPIVEGGNRNGSNMYEKGKQV